MKSRVVVASVFVIAVGTAFYLESPVRWGSERPDIGGEHKRALAPQSPTHRSTSLDVPPVVEALPSVPVVSGAQATFELSQADEQNPYAEEALKAQFMQVADQYEAAMQFPSDSQPIFSEAALKRYLPPDTSDVELPFPLPGYDKPVQVAIHMERYQYFHGETIPVGLVMKGVDPGAQVHAVIQLRTLTGETLQQQTLVADDDTSALYTVVRPGQTAAQWPNELQVHALVELDDHRLTLAAPLRYHAPSAVIVQTNGSTVIGPYLHVPLLVQLNQPGYYFVSGNLYSARSGKPLLHLEAEGALTSAMASLDLRAHIAALKVSGDEGDYQLKDLRLVRAAEDHEQSDVAGTTAQSSFPVTGHPFSSYEDSPYQDPDAEARLAFLRNLGALSE